MKNISDAKLVAAYINGDHAAFDGLVKRHLDAVYSFVGRFLQEQQDAQDVTQETFVKAWRHLKKYDTKRNFKTWLFVIAKNTCLDFLKKRRTIPFSHFEDSTGHNLLTEKLAAAGVSIQQLIDNKSMANAVSQATLKLSPRYQTVLNLHYAQQFSFREISQKTGDPLNTVKSWHQRAIIELKKIFLHRNM